MGRARPPRGEAGQYRFKTGARLVLYVAQTCDGRLQPGSRPEVLVRGTPIYPVSRSVAPGLGKTV